MSRSTASASTTGRRRHGLLALYGAGNLLVVLVGAAIVWAAAREPNGFGVVFGAFLLGVGLVGLAAVLLEAVHGRRAHGAVLGAAPDGSPATVLPRARWLPAVSAAMLAVLGGCIVAAGVVALAGGKPVLGVVLLVVGLGFLALLVPLLIGRMTPGGVYLAAHGVTSVKDGTWWRVGWDDVAGVLPEEPLAVVLRDGAVPERGRSAPQMWRSEVRAPDGVLAVQTRYLSEDPATLSFLLLAYRDRPDLRGQLGTPASLQWEILRPGS